MRGKRITLPVECTGAADEWWHIDLVYANGTTGYVDNTSRFAAESLLRCWLDGDPGEVSFCENCPDGYGSEQCSCSSAVVLCYAEMAKVRIMPMREAV